LSAWMLVMVNRRFWSEPREFGGLGLKKITLGILHSYLYESDCDLDLGYHTTLYVIVAAVTSTPRASSNRQTKQQLEQGLLWLKQDVSPSFSVSPGRDIKTFVGQARIFDGSCLNVEEHGDR
ncbi:hypothetical protein KCU71_g8, partial [Aureobasidium melanogenum]